MERNQFTPAFQKLLRQCPRYSLKQVQTENCGYADTAIKSKNCYYSFCVFYCEDVYYSRYSRKCVDCSGVTFCLGCEGCVESVDCINCYYCAHCRDCRDCAECDYCSDCSSCHDCFGCVGLYQKQYCFFNEQMAKAEYEAWRRALNPAEKDQRELIEKRLAVLRSELGLLGIHQFRCEDCAGEHLSECRNCLECYDSFKLEDCLYNIETNGNRDCCDLSVCFEAELCYSCVQAPLNYNSNFLLHSDGCSDSEFCAFSKNLKRCFGCIYLADKEYHILNKPVPAGNYEAIAARIREELITRRLYHLGLFFVSEYEQMRFASEKQ